MEEVAWHGTAGELTRLQWAVAQHCDCVAGTLGLPSCAAHAMLNDQSSLDHLLYVYRMRKLFIRRELYALPIKVQVKGARPLWTAPPT